MKVLAGDYQPSPSCFRVKIPRLLRTSREAFRVFPVCGHCPVKGLPRSAQLLDTDLAAGGIGHGFILRGFLQIPGKEIGIRSKSIVLIHTSDLSAYRTAFIIEPDPLIDLLCHLFFPVFQRLAGLELPVNPVTLPDQVICGIVEVFGPVAAVVDLPEKVFMAASFDLMLFGQKRKDSSFIMLERCSFRICLFKACREAAALRGYHGSGCPSVPSGYRRSEGSGFLPSFSGCSAGGYSTPGNSPGTW